MATENRNPQNAKPVGDRKSPTNPAEQPGQATRGIGNVQGQKVARQQGGSGTVDQAPDLGGESRTKHSANGLRQGTVDTEERED